MLSEAREYRVLLEDAAGPEITVLWDALDALWAELFAETAGETGLARWEKMMQLPPAGDLEARRGAVLARFRETPPFTEDVLQRMLEELCGSENFHTVTDAAKYELTVRVSPRVPLQPVAAMLARRLPANIAVDLDKYYATHRMLTVYRHRDLAGYMHEEIKEAV
jgi:hypothetical protein